MPSEEVSDGIFCAGRQHRKIPHYIDVITKYYLVCGLVLRFVNLTCVKKMPLVDSYNIHIKEYRYIGDGYVLFFNPAYVCVSGADNGVFCRLCLFDGGIARLCGASA
ncbi:hypothetical protein [Neisseria lactamica]|uniref:hypothetical protein n=1 Tax=Neisseria lactamica TaxID=486 RepID=UPI000E0D2905|nr:hypothetical protein [Neisseria lactamica]